MIRRLTLSLLALIAFVSGAPGQELRDSWHALPEQTVFVLRVPQPAETVEHLRDNTKLGKVLLDGDRWSALMDLIREDPESEWEEMEADLAKLGLTPDDLAASWDKPFGLAMVIERREGEAEPLLMLLAWQEAGELAEKYLEAIERGVEQQEDEPNPVRRVDLDLAGRPVIHLKNPEMEFEYKWDDEAWEDPADMEQFVQPRQMDRDGGEAMEEPELYVTETHVDQSNMLITRIGGRLIAGITMPNNAEQYWRIKEADPDAEVDYDALSGASAAMGVFARFLQAHEDDDRDYARRIFATPGLRPVMPDGRIAMELYGDLRPIMQLLERMPDGEEPLRWMKILGFDRLSTLGFRLAVQEDIGRSGLFLAAPAPRRGVLSLLDGPELEPVPPKWVPAHALNYTHLAIDLGDAYRQVRRTVVDEVGAEAEQGFAQIDASVQSLAGVDLATALAGLGDRVTAVSFEQRLADDPADTQPGDLNRTAIVFQLRDEPVWQRMVMALAALQATGLGPMMEMVEEQGFTGWRLNLPQMEQAVMIGKGYLTWAIGNDVTGQILSVLRSEPQGDAAMVNSPLMERFQAAFDARPGISYRIVDGDRTLRGVVAMLYAGLSQATEQALDPAEAARLRRLKDILPTQDQMRGVMDAAGSHSYMTDDGLVSEGFFIMPE